MSKILDTEQSLNVHTLGCDENHKHTTPRCCDGACRCKVQSEFPPDSRPEFPPDSKPTNPKDVVGGTKVPMGLMPDTVRVAGAMAFLEGALKYGRYNWRVAGVRASIYKDAFERHWCAWWNGEDIDPDSGLPHLWKALACLSILIDAQVSGKLTDDRPPIADLADMIRKQEPNISFLKKHYEDRKPHQYTIEDSK